MRAFPSILILALLAAPAAHAQDAGALENDGQNIGSQDSKDGLSATAAIFGGQDVVPPDVIESGIAQDRIEGLLGANAEVTYRIGDTRLVANTGADIYPVDDRYNRYVIGAGVSQDLALANSGRTRLRLGAGYDYVFADDGRVFDRVRLDAQLIHRHGPQHTSTVRLQYGYRNQAEDRFTGFDQSEWLAELRHTWRPGGGPGSVAGSLIGLRHDADDDRFSYSGYGFRLLGRMPLPDGFTALGRLSVVQRDYDDAFSTLYPDARSDTHIRVSAGLERAVGSNLILFGEAGYADNPSNIPVRDYDGFVGRVGIRWQID